MTAAATATHADLIARAVAAAPPLTSQQRATLAALWRQPTEPCRPNTTSRRTT